MSGPFPFKILSTHLGAERDFRKNEPDSYFENEKESLSEGLWLARLDSWLEPRSPSPGSNVSAVLGIWKNFSISYQLPRHADTIMRFGSEDVALHYQEGVKAACANKCILAFSVVAARLGEQERCSRGDLHAATYFFCTCMVPLSELSTCPFTKVLLVLPS